jgi:cell division protein FtsB
MATRQRKKSVLRALFPPALALGLGGYFLWHGLHGDNGILARKVLDQRVIALTAELKTATHARDEIERRVKLLRSGAIDRDILDERARSTLGFAHANDVVVFHAATQHSDVNWKSIQMRR